MEPNSQQTTILIIDDDESMQDACRQILTKQGYQVETASNGVEGLESAQSAPPDLALVDLKMPGMDGMEVLQRLEEMDPSIVKVVITGYATVESAVDAMKRGAYDFLPKPFTPDELRIIVGRGLEKRRLEAEREALLKEQQKLKENFIAIVSHQLRSPLVATREYLEAVLSGALGEVPAAVQEVLLRMAQRIDGLLKMIRDWLDVSRIEAGKIVEKMNPVNVAAILDECVHEQELLADKEGLQILQDYPPELPPIRGDFDSLKQAFANLLANAIHYNRPQGTVTVSAAAQEDRLWVAISDTGIGIAEENLPFLFEEFFRIPTPGRKETEGSGLGLAIAKKVIDAHSGQIEVASQLGAGTTFTVILPRAGTS